MQTKTTSRKNEYLLITVSDKQCTKHFRIPKYIKSFLIAAGAAISLALVVSNVLVFTQKEKLGEAREETVSIEDAFVKLSSKISTLNKTMALNKAERTQMSDVLAQMEKISGVSTSSMNTPILDRLSAVSDYLTHKELDLGELDDRVVMIKERIKTPNESSAVNQDDTLTIVDDTLETHLDVISLSISQQKVLHDSIPNGYPAQNLGTTSSFGKRLHPTTHEASYHNGVDLKASEGTQVVATADGVIKQADYNKLNGNRISITHNYGFETRYAHLSKMQVKAGDVVQKGDIIGLSGNTGRSDGPHLHYEVRFLDKAYNPGDFLAWEFGDQAIFTKVRGIQWQSLIGLINKQVSRPTLQLSQLAPE